MGIGINQQKRFDQLDVYYAFEQVCLKRHCAWQDTAFYQSIVGRINHGEVLWSCTDEAQFLARCEKLAKLYRTIDEQGYKSQLELGTGEDSEISIAIGRRGELFFADGAHRLCIVKLLGLAEIPVVVTVRHPLWFNTRLKIAHLLRQQNKAAHKKEILKKELLKTKFADELGFHDMAIEGLLDHPDLKYLLQD